MRFKLMRKRNVPDLKPRPARHVTALTAMAMLAGTFGIQSCDDEVLTGQPSWLGNSIYERLAEDGNYTTTLRLIDDLGQTTVLSGTGSKTLFVADDAAYKRWFENNSWGVKNYEQLSVAQKKLLLNNSMVNNAYLIELLGNTFDSEIQPGTCMRRATATSIYDSVPRMYPEQMPATVAWDKHRDKKDGILIFMDGTSAPMIHFLPAYMTHNKITDKDLTILTNGEATSIAEAWVDGKKVVERDIICKNGYVQKVEEVIESAPNMAQILRQHPNMSMWSKFVDRFSAPYYHAEGTRNYNRLNNTNDSVFTLRYYSEVSLGGEKNQYTPDGKKVGELLAFDPGWNHYMYNNTMGRDMHNDAGAMFVPTDKALNEWWEVGGKSLKDEYGSWDNVPQKVLSKLINVNMLSSFSDYVPSKFKAVVNDAKVEMGITPEDVDSCFIGCNGVIYMVNKVFAPSEYSSVVFPALIHENTMKVIYQAIEDYDFLPFLNSMDARFSMILPTNNALLNYIDPATYGEPVQSLLRFYYDTEEKTTKADRYNCTVGSDGTVIVGQMQEENVNSTIVENRLKDLINSMIIVGDVEDGHEYYLTRGGSAVRVKNAGQANSMTFEGGWQVEHNVAVAVSNIDDKVKEGGNGKSYTVDNGYPMGAEKSVYKTLLGKPEYGEFLKLLNGGDKDSTAYNLLIAEMGSGSTKYQCSDNNNNFNMRLFDNFNYTVYVPTSDVIKDMQAKGYLPSWSDFEEVDDGEKYKDFNSEQKKFIKYIIKSRINNFLRYHIQDNSLYVGGTAVQGESVRYETSKINPANGRFFSLGVTAVGDNLEITDQRGNKCHVVKKTGLYNNICREYWFQNHGTTRNQWKTIYSTSDAVVHLIDGALLYSDNQLTRWEDEIEKLKKQ